MLDKSNKQKTELDKSETDEDRQNLNIGAIINQVSDVSAQVSQVSNQISDSNPMKDNGPNINVNFSNFNVNINQSVQNSVSVVNSFDKFDNAGEDDSDESCHSQGGYCSSSCRHYDKEFYDTGGKTLADFDNDGNFGDYCRLGHSISFGSFCKDYE